ncbi:hypothetical protein HY031_02360 [Candidatus Gottesmanbacteria bacterium]|nr:hypothetical protein [Candidatus Gottesmanbacteria bacterium]
MFSHPPLFQNVVSSIVALGSLALFIMLIIGGFNFLFSGGDQKKLEQARGTVTNAIIGLVVIVIAYLILKAISVILGLGGLTTFTIPTK